MFIVGYLGERSGRQIFPITGTSKTFIRKIIDYEVRPVLTPDRAKKRQNGRRSKNDGEPSFTLTGQDVHGVMLRQLNKAESQGNRIYDSSGLATTLASQAGGLGAKTGLYKVDKPRILDASHRNEGIREYKDYSPTLKSRDYKEPRYVDEGNGMRIRRLTPTECERLQGFPDGWTAGLSDTQRYKTLGNAVTVPVVTAVMNQLAQHI